MSGPYTSEDAALRRVEALRKDGVWPGVRRHRDGTFSLTYDPVGGGE